MSKAEIIDENGNKITVRGIYYVSNNNYYFVYTKDETDSDGHVILYILKILQEVTNTPSGPTPTGYLVGVKVTDENEYGLVKQDITNIVAEKQNNAEAKVMYLDISMLQNLKVKDSRIFKLDAELYNKIFKNGDNQNNIEDENITSQITPAVNTSQESTAINSPTDQSDINYQQKYEEELKKNEELQNEINNLNNIINQIKSIIK